MNYFNRIIASLHGLRLGPSPQIRTFINKFGNYKIIAINVCRKPIQKYIEITAELITLGKFNKKKQELNYDKLFHLYLLLTLTDNKENINISLEKNEVVQIKPIYTINDTDCMKVDINKNIKRRSSFSTEDKLSSGTFIEFLNNEIKAQGDNFWIYDSIELNCQNFVKNLLINNNLGTNKIFTFIEQDVSNLIIKPVQKITRFITDLAARFDIIKHGYGLVH